MKTFYYYTVVFGWAGSTAEDVTIVKANSKRHLSSLGFKTNKDTDIERHNSIEEAQGFCKKYLSDYPKHRIGYWI